MPDVETSLKSWTVETSALQSRIVVHVQALIDTVSTKTGVINFIANCSKTRECDQSTKLVSANIQPSTIIWCVLCLLLT